MKTCFKCKGRGKVIDTAQWLFVPVISWLATLFDDDKAYKECPVCKGKGIIES